MAKAPANRTIYTTRVLFTRDDNPSNATPDIKKAMKWFECGNGVNVLVLREGFALARGTASVYECFSEHVAYHWKKKTGELPTKKQLANIEKWQGYARTYSHGDCYNEKGKQYNGIRSEYLTSTFLDGVYISNSNQGQANSF